MKTLDEIYKELESKNIKELDDAWKEAKKESENNKKIKLTICLIIDICAIIFLLKIIISKSLIFLPFFLITTLIINVFVVVIVNILFNKNRSKYNEKYKKIVINKLLNNFFDNVEYFPEKPMPKYIYDKNKYEYYNIYKSEDYFEAQINQEYSIQMAEILTQEKQTYKNSKGETQTRIITKFHGLFAKIIINKSIIEELEIMKNGTVFLQNRLKMDSSEFEKHFDVKCSNKIVGMQLLTADVMEELVEFENKTNMKYDIAIKGNELYLRFHSGEMFEYSNFENGVLDKEGIKKYFYMLNFTYNVSNKLIKIINDLEI